MRPRTWWIAAFLGTTALALGQELWASFDSTSDTTPWTDLIATYIPWQATAVAILTLCVWLPLHFRHAYARKVLERRERELRAEVPGLWPREDRGADSVVGVAGQATESRPRAGEPGGGDRLDSADREVRQDGL